MFRSYGIDINKDSVIEKNEADFRFFIVLNVVLAFIFAMCLFIIFWVYNEKKNKILNEITRYIEEINKKNYKLDIDQNTEDELSILKNEIYKVTIMLKEQAENSMQDKISLKDSISDISHQLKTPLTSINIMLDNIIDNPNMNEEIRCEFLKDIRREITNINFLVQALLKLSKFDSNTITFVRRDYKIIDIINEVIKNVSMLCDLKNIEIVVSGDEEDTLICDKLWQIEALTNIVKNSIEHSNSFGKININYEKNNVYSKIDIIDNGNGIEEEELSHIFERFYKGSNSSRDSIGIGLALAKVIVQNDNGSISVESKINKGTKFTLKYFIQ